MIISLVEIPQWLLSAGVVLCAAWGLSIVLIVWLWFRYWVSWARDFRAELVSERDTDGRMEAVQAPVT